MDEEEWQCSSHGNGCWSGSYSSRRYDRIASYNTGVMRSKTPLWRRIWRKLKKEKRRVFHCSNSIRFTYDPYSYSQNFDQGCVWADQDDLSRSFSARFAVPSAIFENPRLMV